MSLTGRRPPSFPRRQSPATFESSPDRPQPRFQREHIEEVYVRQGPRLGRDVLYEIMLDERYHSAFELEGVKGFKNGGWVEAMRGLVECGYFFTRSSSSFKIRDGLPGEKKQNILSLLANIDLRVDEDCNPEDLGVDGESVIQREWEDDKTSAEDGSEPDDEDFDVSKDDVPVIEIPENDRMVIGSSDSLVVAARDFVMMKLAVLAKTGAGKTYLAMVIAEELAKKGLAFCVIDPTGVWYGLRALANGDASSYLILTIGGEHSDLDRPLLPTEGAAVASLVIALNPTPVIIDLSLMSPADQHGFVADFVDALFFSNRKPIHIFMDEADEFAPQKVDPNYRHQRRCLSVVDRGVRRGRPKGLGWTLITQRSAVINKNVLSQVDGIFTRKMIAPQDIDAAREWMERVGSHRDVAEALRVLPKLSKTKAVYMFGGDQYVFKFFDVRDKETYDTSRTPRAGDPPLEPPRELSKVSGEVMGKVLQIVGKPKEADEKGKDGEDGGVPEWANDEDRGDS